MSARPARTRVRNDRGQWQTLPAGVEHFVCLRRASETPDAPVLLLGLGPEPEAARSLLQGVRAEAGVWFLEAPEARAGYPSAWSEAVPAHWQSLPPPAGHPLSPEVQELLRRSRVYAYRPGLTCFPDFWMPVLGQCRLAETPAPAARSDCSGRPSVMLPGRSDGLLLRELEHAFAATGCSVVRELPEQGSSTRGAVSSSPWAYAPAGPEGERFAARIAELGPDLFFSVNFQGLDPFGERFHTLRAAGTEVAVWCVDNPWHLLSGVRSGYWKSLHLFVTDASFIEPLRRQGATRACHLPLAACPSLFVPGKYAVGEGLEKRIVFVGRSEFPDRQGFFAGQRIPPALLETALAALERGERPDFLWWGRALGLETLWPGTAVRQAGLGAETASLAWRVRCVRAAAAAMATTVVGDARWPVLLGAVAAGIEFLPPVDYYGPLADIFQRARYSLNATSLLLPAGLTQRHFDVWSAGGFLLTDATPGLELFPTELTTPIRFDRPGSLAATVDRLEREPGLRDQLQRAWQAEIAARHTYAARVARILERCGRQCR